MDPRNPSPQIRAFRVGPKNKRIEDPSNPDEPTGYHVTIDPTPSLPELIERHGIVLPPDEDQITPENFPDNGEAAATHHFELFDFSARSDYGRSGVDEAFVRDKLDYFNFRPATLAELICFASHLREIQRDQWFEARKIIALGSVFTTTDEIRKGGWLRKAVVVTYRHYPELECVAGRPHDILSLSRTEPDSDGNWPSSTLFLAASLA